MIGKTAHGTHVENSAKKQGDLEDPPPMIDRVSLGCTQREANADQAVQSKTELLNKLMTTGEADEKDQIRRESSLLGAMT